MKTIGLLLIFAGIAVGMFAFSIDTSVSTGGALGIDRVNNLGLMNEKQNYLFVAGVICIMGAIFVAGANRSVVELTNQSIPQRPLTIEKNLTAGQKELQKMYDAGQITFEEYQKKWNNS